VAPAYLLPAGRSPRPSDFKSNSSRKVWTASLKRTVDAYVGAGKKVVIFSQYPLLNTGIGECDKSPSYLIPRDWNKRRCVTSIGLDQILDRLSYTNDEISRLQGAKVLSVLPSKYFCNREHVRCKVLTEYGSLYFDDNHISQAGSLFLIDAAAPTLSEFLDSGR
jgi:hypothetical protein